ncbi:hypothetical protein BSKO_05997 [Bryopsis sp. KO-2023]|nr:hypothetical protein BSKO_05997 [Bryopsis sp. KO-2023]
MALRSLISGKRLQTLAILESLSTRGMSSSGQMAAIKALRERSGAPISDVKASLDEAGYDQEKAFENLRKKGLAAATKKGNRHAAEGLLGVAKGDGCMGIVEINCETDFVARNEGFCSVVSEAAKALLTVDKSAVNEGLEVDLSALEEVRVAASGARLKDYVAELSGSMRENIKLRRGFLLTSPGEIYTYIHNAPPSDIPLLGKIAGLVSIESTSANLSDSMKTAVSNEELGPRLAMQVVGLRPRFLDRSGVSPEELEKEKAILREHALSTGKPAPVVEKIVMGRLGKFYEDVCLMDQRYVIDESLTVKKLIDGIAKKGGEPGGLRIGSFLRVQCGEGLESEKEEKDFVQEVAEMAGGN